MEPGEVQVLLVFLRAVVAAGEREDHRVAALQFAERADRFGVIRQRVVREFAPWCDVGAHVSLLVIGERRRSVAYDRWPAAMPTSPGPGPWFGPLR